MIDATQASTAFILGLSGAGHCLGMCGGIAAALNLGGARSPAITLAYHTGRISSYTVLGAVLGFAAASIDISAWTIGLRYLAGLLLIGMGLYIANWWRGMALLERAGSRLWQPVQRLSSKWLPLRRWPQAFALGLCWGLMPCGLIYSSLAWAATAQNATTSALMMLLFRPRHPARHAGDQPWRTGCAGVPAPAWLETGDCCAADRLGSMDSLYHRRPQWPWCAQSARGSLPDAPLALG